MAIEIFNIKHLLLSDTQGKALLLKEKILYLLIAAFFVTIYIPSLMVLNNILIGLIFVFSLSYNRRGEKLALLKQRPAIILIIIFYVMHVISAFISHNQPEGFSMLGLRAPLLLFPMGIGLIYIKTELKDRILFLYAFVTTIAAIICLVNALIMYRGHNDTGFLYDDSLSDPIGIQSVYFALMITLAIFSYVYLLVKKFFIRNIPVYVNIAFLLIIQFLLASRTEIGFLYASSILCLAYYFIIRQKKIIPGISVIAGLLILVFLFIKLFPKTLNRFNELQYPGYTYSSLAVESHYNMQLTPEQWNGVNIRLAIWKCGWELSKKNLLIGVPIGDKAAALRKVYEEKQFNFGLRTKKNMHNTYLDVLSSFGVIGLIIFLFGFIILPLRACFIYKDLFGALIIAGFSVSLITETYIDRTIGCVLLAFFISFVTSWKKKPETLILR